MRRLLRPASAGAALRRALAHLCRLLGAGLFLATCGVASYTAGARHRPEPVRAADPASVPVCPR